MTSIASPARRALWVLAAVCAVVIVTAFVMVLSRPSPASLPTGSPQAAVQAYTVAYFNGDWDEVRSHSAQPGDRACNEFGADGPPGVDLLSVTENGDRATVHIRLTDTYLGGPFSIAQGTYDDQFELERIDGHWKVITAPWSISLCTAEELGY